MKIEPSRLNAEASSNGSMKVAIVTSHPVQYQAPLYRALARRGIAVTVMFGARWGVQAMREPGFGVELQWDQPLLDGYDYSFLRNWGLGVGALRGPASTLSRRSIRASCRNYCAAASTSCWFTDGRALPTGWP